MVFSVVFVVFFFFKQKTAYEMRISDWSSDVCSSDLGQIGLRHRDDAAFLAVDDRDGWTPVALARDAPVVQAVVHHARSEERRVGKECVSTCRSRWSPYH